MTAASRAPSGSRMLWRQVYWPQPLDAERVVALLRLWAADQRLPRLVLETRANRQGVTYLLGMPAAISQAVSRDLRQLIPGTTLITPTTTRTVMTAAARFRASTRHRALRSTYPVAAVRALLSALTQVRGEEEAVVQIMLGPGRVPLAVPTNSPSSITAPLWQIAWHGNGGRVDGEKRAALRDKVSEHGFACCVRLGVHAESVTRRRVLLLGLLAAARTTEAAGIQLKLRTENPVRLNTAQQPRCWPLRLNILELVGLTGWPVGDSDLPGQPAPHPKPLPPPPGTTGTERVIAVATAPGVSAKLALSATDALRHTQVLGPIGSGKSVLLGNLIAQDIAADRGVVVVDPQGDLVRYVLQRIPTHRQADVVVLDADSNNQAAVGLNPLTTHGRNPEVVADGLLAVFKQLYADAWGPRTQDVLHACLLTLARRHDASLVMVPLLLTNPGFRRSITSKLHDPIALEPFWRWYESLSPAELQQVIAPLQNKLRQWLIRPTLRAILGQRDPKFSIRQVFNSDRKILLVSLAQGLIGPEAAALLGSIVVAEVWQATLERAAIPPEQRHPVIICLDEFATFLNMPTDLSDALTRSRAHGTSFTLAHQYLSQLSPAMRAAVQSSTRSRICFQLAADDAATIARGTPELTAEDFTALGQYEVYASLFARGRVNPYASGQTLPPSPIISDPDEIRRLSRDRYARPLDEVEASWAELITPTDPPAVSTPTGRRTRRTP